MARRYNSFSRFVKNFDIFGYPVHLNFDKKGNTHQTVCGGLTSYLWFIFITITIIVQFIVMCTNSQALYFSHDFPLNMTDGFEGHLLSMDLLEESDERGTGIYMFLYDTTNDVPVSYEQTSQFITVSFMD
jgi:hypothetical protein